MVIKPYPGSRQSQGSYGIHKAGRESPESSVSQGRLRLLILYGRYGLAVLTQYLLQLIVYTQIYQIIGEEFPDQELRRDIVDLLISRDLLLILRKVLGELQQHMIHLCVSDLMYRSAVQLPCELIKLRLQIFHDYLRFLKIKF